MQYICLVGYNHRLPKRKEEEKEDEKEENCCSLFVIRIVTFGPGKIDVILLLPKPHTSKAYSNSMLKWKRTELSNSSQNDEKRFPIFLR